MTGIGEVKAPGIYAPVASLAKGRITITIESAAGENDGLFDSEGKPAVSENMEARCIYPDGFAKNHQTDSVQDLFGKIVNQLRNRYGVSGDGKAIELPDAVTAGATFEMEI